MRNTKFVFEQGRGKTRTYWLTGRKTRNPVEIPPKGSTEKNMNINSS